MGQSWAEFLLFICCRRAVLLPHGVDDVCVADDVRVLARPRRSRATSSGGASRRTASRSWSVARRSRSGCGDLMVPALWNYFVGYCVGTAIAVIGLYIAFIIPVYPALADEATAGTSRGRGRLGTHYKWIDSIAIALGRASSRSCSSSRCTRSALPWNDAVRLGVHELHDPRGSRASAHLRRLVGAVGEELVQGPGAHGHRGGARAARGGAARRVRAADRSHLGARLGPTRRAPQGALRRSAVERRDERTRLRRPARVARSARLAYASKSKSSSETADCTTPHIASRKSDMKRMSSSACASAVRTSPK